jgi:predicted small lipoprotein YifL
VTLRPGSAAARLAFVGAAALLIALGGCGRKGALDLPPTSTAPQPATDENASAGGANTAAAPAPQHSPFDPLGFLNTSPPEEKPTAASPRKKFVLDPILN